MYCHLTNQRSPDKISVPISTASSRKQKAGASDAQFFFFCLYAVAQTTQMRLFVPFWALLFGAVAAGVKDGEFEMNSQHVVAEGLGRAMGYPRISGNKPSDPIFSEDEMEEIISHEGYDDSKLNLKDYLNQCARDLVRVAVSIRKRWAISMIDADGKLPAGVMYGNAIWAGSVRECHAVRSPPDPTDKQRSFGGKFCAFSWTLPSFRNLSISSGLCIPDSCKESDFFNLTNVKLVQTSRQIIPQLAAVENTVSKYIKLTGIVCQAKDTKYSDGAVAVLVVLYIFLFFVITGTSLTVIEAILPKSLSFRQQADAINSFPTEIKFDESTTQNGVEHSGSMAHEPDVELLVPQNKSSSRVFEHIGNFFKCFCVITNGSKILDTSDKGGKELRCIHGIRFLSMSWVILGHTYAFCLILYIVGNTKDFLNIMDTVPFQMVLQGTYSVDSFFVLSGFLLTYLFLREMNARDGKISWLTFYLHRYWRLTPVYAIVMAFDTTLTWYLISGPFLPPSYENGCKKGWWWNLLYINNFAPDQDSCMGWSWYLANDMQFYIISPLFLYALWRWPHIGLGIIASLFCGSWIANFTITYNLDLFAGYTTLTSFVNAEEYMKKMQLYFTKLYVKPYTRIGPYLIGVFVGYIFTKFNGQDKVLSKRNVAIGWILSTALGLYITFGLYHVDLNRVESSFYNAFNRSTFSACLAWVIFACLTGHGGPVNTILSHPIFIPLGRLTYCAYLIHPILMTVYYLSLPSSLIMTHLQMVTLFFGFLLASYGIAFVTTLVLESPTMAMERWLRGTAKAKAEGARA